MACGRWHIKKGKIMSAGANPYRTKLWELLAEETRMGVAMPDPNPYTLNANYPAAKPLRNSSSWNEILEREPGIADLILSYTGISCEPYHRSFNAYWPRALRPPQLPTTFGNSELHMTQLIRIERHRSNILGPGPQDLLTVTFSGVVTRGDTGRYCLDYFAALAERNGWPFDADAICRAMEYTHTWTDVSKIRLVPNRSRGIVFGRGDFIIELFVGELEETVQLPGECRLLHFGAGPNMTELINFDRDLRQRLHLRHAFVGGADEYTVQ